MVDVGAVAQQRIFNRFVELDGVGKHGIASLVDGVDFDTAGGQVVDYCNLAVERGDAEHGIAVAVAVLHQAVLAYVLDKPVVVGLVWLAK